MHAEVRAANPGECPICRMALERIGFVPGAVKPYLEAAGTVDLRAIDNVKKHNIVDFVRRHSLLPVQSELRGPAWIEEDGTIAAVFYNDQIAAMAADEPATFRFDRRAGEGLRARRTTTRPSPGIRSTSRIRFRSAPGRPAPPPGEPAGSRWRRAPPGGHRRRVRGAQSPEGPYVLAWSGHGYTFVKRPSRSARPS